MARFFIDRPIFAIVIAIMIMLAGALSIVALPVEQYPTIAPPSIQITTTYPGASAETVTDTVVQVIEQQMNGLNNLLYLSSNADDSGTATLSVTLEPIGSADALPDGGRRDWAVEIRQPLLSSLETASFPLRRDRINLSELIEAVKKASG